MEINSEVAEQVLDELFPVLEALETQSTAILRFMKEKGIASEQDLAPYLEQAGEVVLDGVPQDSGLAGCSP